MNKQNSFSNKTIEALKMAIEALEEGFGTLECEGMLPHRYQETIQACKEALAEAEKQEPVGYTTEFDLETAFQSNTLLWFANKNGKYNIPLYTHPATWQSLNDNNILNLFKPKFQCEIEDFELIDFARAIEQALKELNAKK